MKKTIQICLFACAMLAAPWGQAADAPYVAKLESTPEDLKALMQMTRDFQTAIVTKDVKLLSTLVHSSRILFASPMPQKQIDEIRAKYNVNFDGIAASGYDAFAQFIRTSKMPIEEKFHNIKVIQDGTAAWINFDYEFLEDKKVANYGVEAWQLAKLDGKWKIISVVWSTHLVMP